MVPRLVEKLDDVVPGLVEELDDVDTRLVEELDGVETRLVEELDGVETRLVEELNGMEFGVVARPVTDESVPPVVLVGMTSIGGGLVGRSVGAVVPEGSRLCVKFRALSKNWFIIEPGFMAKTMSASQ